MKLHLPRTLHMRLVLAIAFIQLLAVGGFAAYWVAGEVSAAVDARRVLAHRLLRLAASGIEDPLAQGDVRGVWRQVERLAADPTVAGVTVRDARGRIVARWAGTQPPLHPLAAWFEPPQTVEVLARQLGPAAQPLGILTLVPAHGPLNARVEEIVGQVLVFFLIVLGLDLVAIQLIIRFFVAPLKPLTEMAMNVSQGFLDSTVMPEPTASEEVRQVGIALVTSARVMQKQIHDLEETRARLAENELRPRNLVNSMREVLVELDAQGNVRFLNPAWEKLTGYDGNDRLGRPFSHFLCSPSSRPGSCSDAWSSCRRAISSSRCGRGTATPSGCA